MPSIVTVLVMVGRAENGEIVWTPAPAMLEVDRVRAGARVRVQDRLAERAAPESLVLVTASAAAVITTSLPVPPT